MLTDTDYMARAFALSERGRGRTSPNPMVGAVVVDREGVIVGSGAHQYAGGPHAEVHAMAAAGARAAGATLYCTLEPCSHTGRTPPCAPLVADAGITRVVIALEDPNPLVAGRGIAHLRARGIEVIVGPLADEVSILNAPFLTMMRSHRPFVTMKVALSLDGRVAAAPGARTPLTGAAANRLIHRERAEVDAIAVGSGTILSDDPRLTARGAFRSRPLVRVIFDSRLRTPPAAKVLSTLAAGPVIIVTTRAAIAAAPDREAALAGAGAQLETVPGASPLPEALDRLATLGVSSLVVEGGPALHRSFWDLRLIDRVQAFVAPRSLGPGGVGWLPFPVFSGGAVVNVNARPVGEDVLIEAYVHRID